MSNVTPQSEEEKRLLEMNRRSDLDPYNLSRYAVVHERRDYSMEFVNRPTTENHQPKVRVATPAPTTSKFTAVDMPMAEHYQSNIRVAQPTPGYQTCEEVVDQSSLASRIINATDEPLDVAATEQISVCDDTGVYANKEDESRFAGSCRIADYPINCNLSPTLIHKQATRPVCYTQNVCIKYLKPPAELAPPPGDINVHEGPEVAQPRAPPIIIRQTPLPPICPQPQVVREQPPCKPVPAAEINVQLPARMAPLPPRRVVIERLPPMPPKPVDFIIERWLPYEEQERQIKFIKSEKKACEWAPEKNLIICWDAAKSCVTQQVNDLGTFRADPNEYVNTFSGLLSVSEVNAVITANNLNLPLAPAPPAVAPSPKLAGDLHALKFVDLDRYGLGEYRHLQPGGYQPVQPFCPAPPQPCEPCVRKSGAQPQQVRHVEQTVSEETVYREVFAGARVDVSGKISDREAVRLIEQIYFRMGKVNVSARTEKFVADICIHGVVDFEQFKRLTVNWFIVEIKF